MSDQRYGAVEAGGTKFVCEVLTASGEVVAELRIATSTPAETLAQVSDFFAVHAGAHGYAGIGIASFGPVDVHTASPHYGYILQTPKPHWSNTDLRSALMQRFSCPVMVDTDVNAAARAEALQGAGRGCETVVYVTVGTGIGGGIWTSGHSLQGRLHPEMGHIRVPLHIDDGDFTGVCPFHGDCLEGLASGPAILARHQATLATLPAGHPAFAREAYYLGQLATTIILLLSPQRLIFGGGVMQQSALLPLIRQTVKQTLAGYAGIDQGDDSLAELIVAPALGERAGIGGAFLLAIAAP